MSEGGTIYASREGHKSLAQVRDTIEELALPEILRRLSVKSSNPRRDVLSPRAPAERDISYGLKLTPSRNRTGLPRYEIPDLRLPISRLQIRLPVVGGPNGAEGCAYTLFITPVCK